MSKSYRNIIQMLKSLLYTCASVRSTECNQQYHINFFQGLHLEHEKLKESII